MSKKILIIEDDVNILYGLQAKLSVEGFSVKAEAGDSGIEEILFKIKFFKPDYVILDLMLPMIDGFDVLSAIKADNEISGIPVFI
ncbi:MAG: response regulator, partial [Candidatus Methanoperedens sp.]|nr:response regulator [Candidatus Methanoperedens sp.]